MNNGGKDMAVKKPTSNYISNMMLPEKVKATRSQPLGPDCIISNTEVTDPAILKNVQYYWCVSRETGCVECLVKHSKSNKTVAASDPRCVITKKHRRFEAYCCMICRFTFVTIFQALTHLKAIHRTNNKILIQDKDVFDNLDKAMEVPPVPLPWHVAKKLVEQAKHPDDTTPPPTYVIPPGSLTSSTIASPVATQPPFDSNVPDQATTDGVGTTTDNSAKTLGQETYPTFDSPMACIISALTGHFSKGVAQINFDEDCSKLNATFADGTNIIAMVPDLSSTTSSIEIPFTGDIDEPLKFFVDKTLSKNGDTSAVETVTLRSNRPQYARKLFSETIQAAASESKKPLDANNNQEADIPAITEVKSLAEGHEENESESSKANKPAKKSVRFSVGHPDSDDERAATPISPEIYDQETGVKMKDVPTIHAINALQRISFTAVVDSVRSCTVSNPVGEPVEDNGDNGLQTVISDLMSTASKGRIIAPTSPVSSTSAISASIPQVGSSPALLSMGLPTSTTGSLTRVQSWSPSVAPSPFSVASMRRPYTARGFTYAEKIQYMKQQNDYDAEFVSKHIREKGASKSKGSDDAKANSDGEERMTLRKRSKNRRYSEEEYREDEDSDSQEASLTENAALAAAYTSLIQRGLFNANIFPSEYYGSGEWANTAFETLKNLQPLLKSQEETSSTRVSSSEISPSRKAEAADSNRSFVDSKESFSDDNVSMIKKATRTKPYQPRKRYKSNNESSSSADDPGSPPKRKKHRNHSKLQTLSTPVHSDSRLPSGVTLHSATMDSESFVTSDPWVGQQPPRTKTVVEKLPSQMKVPLSPLLSDTEKDHIQQHHHTRHLKTEPSSTLTVSRIRSLNEPPVKHLSVSALSSRSMGAKCSSDPNLSSSTPDKSSSHSQRHIARMSMGKTTKPIKQVKIERTPDNLLHANDLLELIDNVTTSDFDAKKLITARLKSSEPDTEKPMTMLSGMPEVFRNCIESRVKIRLVEKVYSCKVCGFSVDTSQGEATSQGGVLPLDLLEAHVMEHSLKELYATKL